MYAWFKKLIADRKARRRRSSLIKQLEEGYTYISDVPRLAKDCVPLLKEMLIKAEAGDVNQYSVGICGHIDDAFASAGYDRRRSMPLYSFFPLVFEGWPGHSGNGSYPIKEERGIGRWEGRNLERRISLLKYMIATLEEYNGYKG